jgi:magnesium-transporting ATPase (P-type)
MKNLLTYLAAAALAIFGLATLFSSSAILLDLFSVRETQGNYVYFIVFTNFLVSLLYLVAAYGFVKNKFLALSLLLASLVILIVAFAGLWVHIWSGGLYEMKTMGAMVFRIIATFGFAVAAYFINKKSKSHGNNEVRN